jgi:hypothetical protein
MKIMKLTLNLSPQKQSSPHHLAVAQRVLKLKE